MRVFAIALLCPGLALAQLVDHDLLTKYGFTGEERTISWTHEGADYFEVQAIHFENGTSETLTVTGTQTPWTPQRAGHYTIRVRACNEASPEDLCSEWHTSDQVGFWLFFWISAPEF